MNASQPSCGAVHVDTLRGVAYGNLEVGATGRALPRAYLERVLAALSASFPDTVSIRPTSELLGYVTMALGGLQSGRTEARPPILPAWAGYPELTTQVAFTVRRSGTLTDVHLLVPGDSAVAGRLVRAITDANALRGGETLPDSGEGDSIPVVLRLSVQPDSNAAASQPLLAIMQVRPEGTAAKPAPYNPSPRFPERERQDDVQAVTLVWFDVDERGRMVRGTFGAAPPVDAAEERAYRAFAAEVERVVHSWRFYPGTAGGCPVRQRVVELVKFLVGGGPWGVRPKRGAPE
jgi:hypothetical protein